MKKKEEDVSQQKGKRQEHCKRLPQLTGRLRGMVIDVETAANVIFKDST